MRHRIGRTQRWWTSGFALLGLAICGFLPLGVLGALDASYTRSVAVPHQRPAGQVHLRVAPHLATHAAEAHLSLPIRPVPPVFGAAMAGVLASATAPWAGLVMTVLVLLALGGTAVLGPPRTVLLARRPTRGPPRSC